LDKESISHRRLSLVKALAFAYTATVIGIADIMFLVKKGHLVRLLQVMFVGNLDDAWG